MKESDRKGKAYRIKDKLGEMERERERHTDRS